MLRWSWEVELGWTWDVAGVVERRHWLPCFLLFEAFQGLMWRKGFDYGIFFCTKSGMIARVMKSTAFVHGMLRVAYSHSMLFQTLPPLE